VPIPTPRPDYPAAELVKATTEHGDGN